LLPKNLQVVHLAEEKEECHLEWVVECHLEWVVECLTWAE
jgi:hypothetical protein